MSHSPAASQSSNSSLSPRQQSPVGWQHGCEADIWSDNNALPPPPGITDTIWQHGNEVGRSIHFCVTVNFPQFLSPSVLGPSTCKQKARPEITAPANVLKQELTSVYRNVLKLNGKAVSAKCILISIAKACLAAAFSAPVINPLGYKPLRL